MTSLPAGSPIANSLRASASLGPSTAYSSVSVTTGAFWPLYFVCVYRKRQMKMMVMEMQTPTTIPMRPAGPYRSPSLQSDRSKGRVSCITVYVEKEGVCPVTMEVTAS
eukprot:CAMPEP_0169428630 /NCGR_PEP_ID=MMETSP1042-20121227/1429_1 /TAXON_ID=464988 /ORGANISM="Hemiselmis andersenii, Strain CCMP1180" /LENGTH=107 /DNA_ID=CAMNT_0009538813 /DNA_START=132 /DNA_END=455 /DNA_ORIENTATION=-